MIEILAWGGFSVGNFMQQLENLDFFSIVLPFLLIFAVVYALLIQIPVFKGDQSGKGGAKGAAVLIAFVIGLLALQFGAVPAFFQAIFPNFGIGVAILLVALILAGSFISSETSYKWIFFGLGALIFLIVTIVSLSSTQFIGGNWFQDYGALSVVILVVVGAIVGVVIASKNK